MSRMFLHQTRGSVSNWPFSFPGEQGPFRTSSEEPTYRAFSSEEHGLFRPIFAPKAHATIPAYSPEELGHARGFSSPDENGPFHQHVEVKSVAMEAVVGVVVSIVLLVLLIWLIKRCCCGGTSGQVIAGPPAVSDGVYPQQQYAPAQHVVTTYPVSSPAPAFGVPVYPTGGAPYPTTGAPYPNAGAPYPTAGAPYPTAGAPYPTAGAPYPYPTSEPPYPTGNAPYPTGNAPYPTGAAAPNAPELHTVPPSYEQAVGEKSTPYNPHFTH